MIAGVLLALGVSAFFVVRLGLRPLDRMEVTAGRDRRRRALAAGEPRHAANRGRAASGSR